MKVFAFLLLTICSSAISSEIHVDLENLTNKAKQCSATLCAESEFIGYTTKPNDKHRFARSVDLSGLDWAFWFGNDQKIAKPNADFIGPVTTFGKVTFIENQAVHGNQFYWENGQSSDYQDESVFSAAIRHGGFSFQVSPNKIGAFQLDLYSHNWLASSDFEVCTPTECIKIMNDITLHMTSIKNSATFTTQTPQDVITINYVMAPRQYDFDQSNGYHAIEAVKLTEVK
ncbi:hypothetical protein QWZ04_13055 [Vibrio tapetis subsp. quintayensis]|uniref:hypothetical protein n=1 Tax=Vibrio tapetis TaxID=52443 RepID=UPI0025B29633|nr:hypothetical protein [Vibrio tapetis]MDN3681249.1 hypothetical protein [Vibrio tapetis subsp. quintayensis]